MNKFGLLGYAAAFAPRLFEVRRSTWIAAGVGFLVLLVLMLWAAVALVGALWGQARNLSDATPDVVRDATRAAVGQVEVIVPGVREKLGEIVPALKAEQPPRDVSGTDVGPVARYPGLARAFWHREWREITVRYEGAADYAAVLDHYVSGFAAQAYRQNVLSAAPDEERHEYIKDADRVGFILAKDPKGVVKVTIVTVLP
ncbi:MAG: hypothetical protein FIA96_15030 [Betaproteobacteria bacterium]|nr:hypothetical protein [Betaproteobacteria bacterium]